MFSVEVDDRPERFGEVVPPVEKFVPKNTLKTQSCIWSTFKKFCHQRRYVLSGSTNTERLSEMLADWGCNMRKANGSDYKESVVKTMWNITAKMLQEMYYSEHGRIFDPFKDIEFKKARDSRDMKRRQLRSCPDKRKVSSVVLNAADRYKTYSVWDENTPSGLQKKFFYIAAFELAWNCQAAATCLVHYFKEEFDSVGNFTGRIEYNPTFGSMGERSHSPCESKWLVADTLNPESCPVRLFQRLINRREAVNNVTTERFFLTPNPNWNKSDENAWFKDYPVGRNQIALWIKAGAEKLGIDTKKYKITNYSKTSSTSTQPCYHE